jgi:hypothetical protein
LQSIYISISFIKRFIDEQAEEEANAESQANRKYLAYAKKAEKDGKINAAKLMVRFT